MSHGRAVPMTRLKRTASTPSAAVSSIVISPTQPLFGTCHGSPPSTVGRPKTVRAGVFERNWVVDDDDDVSSASSEQSKVVVMLVLSLSHLIVFSRCSYC